MNISYSWACALSLLALSQASCERRNEHLDGAKPSAGEVSQSSRGPDRPAESLKLELAHPGTSLLPPDSLTPKEVQVDLAHLDHALTYGWAGPDPAESRPYQRALSMVRDAAGEQSPDEFCVAISDMLALLPDAHFAVSKGATGQCGDPPPPHGQVGLNVSKDRAKPWRGYSLQREGRTVKVLGISRFLSPDHQGWEGMVEFLTESAPDAYIVDLRGNGGGNDTAAYWVAQVLLGRRPVRPGISVSRRQTLQSQVLVANRSILAGEEIPAQHRSHLEDAQPEAFAQEWRRFKPGPASYLDGDFESFGGSLWVLTDRRCGSSCENAVQLLSVHPRVKVIGHPTAGAIHYGQAGSLILPHSRLVVTIATQRVDLADGQFYEKVGFQPDILVSTGEDALDIALERAGRTLSSVD